MAKVEDVKVLNIDGTPYAVDGMSEEVQAMVEIFNKWNQQEADVRENLGNELALVQAAKNDLSRRIILQVRQDNEETEKEAADVIPEVEDAPTEDAAPSVD